MEDQIGYRITSLFGWFAFPLLAWLGSGRFGRAGGEPSTERQLSVKERNIPWRMVAWGMGLQLLFALVVLKSTLGRAFFASANRVLLKILAFTQEGSRFVFGGLLDGSFSLALELLPIIIFFSALTSVLQHFGVLQRVVAIMAWAMRRTLRTTGPETLAVSSNIFLGMTEAPLLIRSHLPHLSQSELMAVMVGGFATVAGAVLGAYVGILQEQIPDIAGHLLASSVMSAPGTFVIAKLMLPPTSPSMRLNTRLATKVETEAEGPRLSKESRQAHTTQTRAANDTSKRRSVLPRHRVLLHKLAGLWTSPTEDESNRDTINAVDAAARGASDGLKLALNVAAMLIAFVALVALFNATIGFCSEILNHLLGISWRAWTLQELFSYALWPVAFMLGIPPSDCLQVSELLGEKIVLNELIAYQHLGRLMGEGNQLSPRAATIASYALCGFANFGSIAVQIGGLGSLAPSRRQDLAKLGLRAMLGGLLVTCMNGALAGVLT